MPSQGTRKERGYDYKHEKLRKQLAPDVEAGRKNCWRCGERILAGEPWDLGHSDEDRTKYMGPEHQRCNRATAGRQTQFNGPPVDTSRDW